MLHIVAISSQLYDKYLAGNPLKLEKDSYSLKSDRIDEALQKHFACSKLGRNQGLLLEDQDGTSVSSHWERKVFGSELMTSSGKKGSFISEFTLAVLDSTGWYSVNYSLVEQTTWGANKGCEFLNIDNCDFP